ncbi:NUDIX hydrolase [Paenibacillus oralis]|uniref:NUDIX hydrolase n=2 Tax=Paenibacillus oralis TaxID=2490856 RepID=A0A3P3TU65_9BACL|nr:NUDIX hydrolase [Paenibacillus oralis]
MLSRLVNLIPRDWLVYMYKYMPSKKFKNWVVYRTQHKFMIAVLGVLTNEKGQVLLLKHTYRRDEPWGMPGGWMELEQPEAGLVREIYEETRFRARITGLAKAIYDKKPARVDLVFRGRIVGGTFTPSVEISDYMYCDPGHWPQGLPAHQKKLILDILARN